MARKRPEPVKYKVKNIKKYKGDPTGVWARSSWEKILFNWLDKHPNCILWGSEEVVIPYIGPDGQPHRYFPDNIALFEVNGKRVTYLIEVKPWEQCQMPKPTERKAAKTLLEQIETYNKNQCKWEAAENYCKKRGWIFKIITERELGIENRVRRK